ncbi:MAG: IS3 family transposase [Betaproteobacteria bacterium]
MGELLDCRQQEYADFAEAYAAIAEYMWYYNHRRRHGAIRFMSPEAFPEALVYDLVPARARVA